MDNKKNVILLVIGIILAVLICVGLISLLTDGNGGNAPAGESTVATTGEGETTQENASDATGAPEQKETTGDTEIDQTVDPEDAPVDGTIGNTGHQGETGNKVPDTTTPSENDPEPTIGIEPEPTQGEGSTGGEAEPTDPGDSKTEIDFNDF